MAGQVSQIGATALANHMGGLVPPALVTAAPTAGSPVYVPGLVVVDTASSTLYYWNSTTWVVGTEPQYIALLTGDPTQAGANGGYAETVADIVAVEDTTAGYARQSVTWGPQVALYSASTAYSTGTVVQYEGFCYTCITAGTGNAPSGGETSNTYWQYTPNANYPAVIANTNTLTFGPYTADQALSVQWAALVTCETGSTGLLKYMWTLPTPQQVSTSQSIQAGPGSLTLSES